MKRLIEKLILINDSPQKIAQGFGLGVFLGVMPGVGLIAALVLSSLFRVNKASTIIGTLITNTWLSFITLVVAIQIGAAVMGVDWHVIYSSLTGLFRHFEFKALAGLSFSAIILPTVIGFIVVAGSLGILSYLFLLACFSIAKKTVK